MITRERILTTLILLTLSTSGVLAWNIFGGPSVSPKEIRGAILEKFAASDPEQPTALEILPESKKLTQLSKQAATSPALSREGNGVLYYERYSGKVLSVAFSGASEKILSSTVLKNFISSIWSPTTREVVSIFTKGSTKEFVHFDYTTKEPSPLPLGVTSVAFSPDGNQLAYFQPEGADRGVYLRNAGGSTKRILETRAESIEISWPSADTIALIIAGAGNEAPSLFTMTPEGQLTKLIDALPGLETRWSKKGTRVLISFFDVDGVVKAVALDLATIKEWEVPAAVRASQCGWSIDEKTITCGVNLSWPPSIDSMVIAPQALQSIDITSGTSVKLYESSNQQPVSVTDILVSPLDDYVVFINAFDGKLYSIKRDN